MAGNGKSEFIYLNQRGAWPNFHREGLSLGSDGTLRLAALPLAPALVPDEVKSAPIPKAPSGVALAPDGTVFFSDPQGGHVLRISGCDQSVSPLCCLPPRDLPGASPFVPRGLMLAKNRAALYVVDSGSHRVLVLDPGELQLLEILGQRSGSGPSGSGSAPGQLNHPWSIAGDRAGNVYVLDFGNQRVQKWNSLGELEPEFWDHMRATGNLKNPGDICIWENSGKTWIFVVDLTALEIFAFDSGGHAIRNADGTPLSFGKGTIFAPLGMAAGKDSVWIGDNAALRVFQFSISDSFSFEGAASGYAAPVASLAADGQQNLWVHAGTGAAPVALWLCGARRTRGTLWSSAIQVDHPKVNWQRLQAQLAPLAPDAHLELFVHTSDHIGDAPPVNPGDPNPFADPRWLPAGVPAAVNLDSLYIGGNGVPYLWVGAQFTGGGASTPALSDLRVEFDRDSYLRYLPAIYREDPTNSQFLTRFLSLFESFFEEVEGEIKSLPALFDPYAVPPEFLTWLAAWLGLELDQNWTAAKQRQVLSEIFELYAWRGTPQGLRQMLKLFAGVDCVIQEPLLNAAWWCLPTAETSCCDACSAGSSSAAPVWQNTQNSVLGINTMLAPAQPQGAVVGTSAVLDQSHLINVDEFGSPLFIDVAYQFSVQIYRSQVMCPDALPRIRALLDQEKPAHTIYDLCIVDPQMSVGIQCRLGIDSVVGGPPRSLSLGSDQRLGQAASLAGPGISQVGKESRLGVSTRLG
ncbi:MAG TPA: phage tail protein [Candidatus Solibacter sp.]|nr:phage tail protein [Candidatus Solibacter sp.]